MVVCYLRFEGAVAERSTTCFAFYQCFMVSSQLVGPFLGHKADDVPHTLLERPFKLLV